MLAGMQMKFTVLKNDDILNLDPDSLSALDRVVGEIMDNRKAEGKKSNTYLVINTDEPYAAEIIEIMKRHGHWG
ncbi:hypothetical protein RJP21_30130 [Paenibacillus sp. VCA1]|uniref:hypothetical protein n=1 Tax=Paenibacillus sp. VCA1 TaxID=3039148 RepID=UPI002870F19B|nr:hypothetical protein [Paenibacillus sp. VCA1]MDR9857855.1 hypothetical protein [Paenibacillus sp. VCA1]